MWPQSLRSAGQHLTGARGLAVAAATVCASLLSCAAFINVLLSALRGEWPAGHASWFDESGTAAIRESRRLGNSWFNESGTAAIRHSRRLGNTCKGAQQELRPCHTQSCNLQNQPIDCEWGPWSNWGACDCGGTRQHYRSVITQGRFGGMLCQGPERQVEQCLSKCNTRDVIDCKLSLWSEWSACTRSCEGGQQYRTRNVEQRSENGGAMCGGSVHDTQVCNMADCPGSVTVDCSWSDWSKWSTCSVTCGNGEMSRTRSVKHAPERGGRLCEAATTAERAKCGIPCEAESLDCRWSDWSVWSACSKSCDGGQRYRARSILRKAQLNGAGCGGLFEDFKSCASQPCGPAGQDCTFGDWGPWAVCSSTCNGHHSRTRSIAVLARDGGRPCSGSTQEIVPCNTGNLHCIVLDRDCKYGNWQAWSQCSHTCGGGSAERKRVIQKHAEGRGLPCSGDLVQIHRCNLNACSGKAVQHCQWSPWSGWSAKTCGGGQKRRHRTVVAEAKHGGNPCDSGSAVEVGTCSTVSCFEQKMICDWSSWNEWSVCERGGKVVTCGGGQKKRNRLTSAHVGTIKAGTTHVVRSMGPGRRLAELANAHCREVQDELQPCAETPCVRPAPIECRWGGWNAWSSCPCSGIQERHRVITTAARNGGSPCTGPEVETKPCTPHCEDVPSEDCKYGPWTEWSACPVTCGGVSAGGYLTRKRTVIRYAQGVGRQCKGDSSQKHPCNEDPCPEAQSCVWGVWSPDSACSATCGGGQMSRTRHVVQVARNGGKPCMAGDSMRVSACNMQPCPTEARDCELGAWNDWQVCTAVCGGGWQHRSRVVIVEGTQDGIQCEGDLQNFRSCGTQPCKHRPKVDCVWGPWSSWDACTALCNGHKEHQRSIAQMAANGGKECDGPEREMRPCNLHSPTCTGEVKRDCVMSDWSVWRPCTARCGGGQTFRDREVLVHARNLGKPCSGSVHEVQACNTLACAHSRNIDCQWSQWDEWSACSRSCGGGQKNRHRGIDVEPGPGGNPCLAQAAMETRPCNVAECGGVGESCAWSKWEQWHTCSRTCGGGQQQRSRRRSWKTRTSMQRQLADSFFGIPLSGAPARPIQQSAPLLGSPNECSGSQKEIRPCGIAPCNGAERTVACRWADWSEWGSCSCEGLAERDRGIGARATGGGLTCVGPSRETRRCKPHCDDQTTDCQFSDWSGWGTCTATCGGGQITRSRSVQRHAQGYGAGCNGGLEEVRACSTPACLTKQDCQYSPWSGWTACSHSCGGGMHSRTRQIQQHHKGYGEPCNQADLSEVEACGDAPCHPWNPRDCKWANWASWSRCTGTGFRHRQRGVRQELMEDGRPCEGVYQQYQKCQARSGPLASGQLDCQLWSWSDWTTCFDRCSGHEERSRGVKVYAAGGRPCIGALRQVRPCAGSQGQSCQPAPENIDCLIGAWSDWSECSATCGGGQRFADRLVQRQARGAGKQCDAALKHTEPCNTAIACIMGGPVDCRWGEWGPFSTCSVTCGGGEKQRLRAIRQPPELGGRPCELGDATQIVPCATQSCNQRQYCVWAPWSGWMPCSASCGGGQMKRRRNLQWSAHLPEETAAMRLVDASLAPVDVAERSSPLTALVRRHSLAIMMLAVLGVVTSLLASAFILVVQARRCSSAQLVAASPAATAGGAGLGPGSEVARPASGGYAVLRTEEPWTLSEDEAEHPLFTADESS